MRMSPIIGAPIHVWRPDLASHPWPPGRTKYAHGPCLNAEDREWITGRAIAEFLGWHL
jgi:hypothetical protein